MKKAIALLLAALMLLSLAACAAKPAEAPAEAPVSDAPAAAPAEEPASEPAPEESARPYEGVTLNYWMPPHGGLDQETWDAHMADFEAETGIKVVTTIVPWGDMSAKYLTAFMSGQGPDVFYTTNELNYELITSGSLLELTPYFTAEEVADQLFWSAGTQMGAQYAAPYNADPCARGMIFNLDLMEAAGVTEIPQTREELIEAGLKIKEAGVCEYPLVLQLGSSAHTFDTFIATLWSGGGDILNTDCTEVTLDSQEDLDALTFIHDLIFTHEIVSADCLSIDQERCSDLFADGKIAMATYEAQYATDRDFDFNWRHTLGVNDGQHETMTWSPIDCISINANTENTDAALALFKYLISVENRKFLRENTGSAHICMNASDSYDIPNADKIESVEEMSAHTRGVPITKGMSDMQEIIATNVQLMAMGELTPQEAMDAMQKACESRLAD